MKRRHFIFGLIGLAATPYIGARASDGSTQSRIGRILKPNSEWRQILPANVYHILREEGTEPSGSSPLNHEKRKGSYVCAGCELPLFDSEMKYDSGTGWPSFFTVIPDHVETKLDFKIIFPRTEYHCARCGGHQGHVFDDGPQPTGKRYCNNGLALKFIPEDKNT